MTTLDQIQDRSPCPYCREPILPGAIKCRHCHTDLSPLATDSGEGELAPRTIRHAIPRVLSKYAIFSGRAVRREYWGFLWFTIVCQFVTWTLSAGMPWQSYGEIISTLLNLAFLIPSFSVMTRRLHDVGRSGWWWLISLTVIGLVPLIYWLASKGQIGPNQYGPAPRFA